MCLIVGWRSKTKETFELTHHGPVDFVADGFGELGKDGARALSDYCMTTPWDLQVLSCNNNELSDEGGAVLMEAFQVPDCALQRLSLEGNDLASATELAIVQCLLPNLKYLNLEANDDMPTKALTKRFGEILKIDEEDEDNDEEADDLAGLLDSMKLGVP